MVSPARGVAAGVDEPGPVSPYARQPVSPMSPPVESQPTPPPYSYTPQPVYSQQQPVPPYDADYDPYAARQEEPRNNTMRWVLIGCVGLSLFCCCATVVGLVIIDQACLWDQIPILSNILRALNFYSSC
jgi:hypothetical protein